MVPKSTRRPKLRSSGWCFVGVVDLEEMAVLLTQGSQAGFARGALVCMAEQSGSSQTGILVDKTVLEGTLAAPLWCPSC